MRAISVFPVLLIVAAVFLLTGPGAVHAQGDAAIAATVLGEGTFVTVKATAQGDLLSLYKVRGDSIILVDVVINTTKQSSMSISLPKRYLHRMDVENK